MTPGAELQRRAGPLPGPAGAALSRLYGLVIRRINRRFDAGRGVVRFDRPVISVGNLSVGGTGKTPMVEFLVASLLAAGRRPCIAMRGYRAAGTRDSRGQAESDEASVYKRRFPGVPVVARANRIQGLIELFAQEYDDEAIGSDCIVLDDGFQHRQIARDLDVVLVDASRDPFADRLLPAGWLREPVGSLARAGAVVITHAESAPSADITAMARRIAGVRGDAGADAVARHAWSGLVITEAGQEREAPVAWLSGKRIAAACAIGNPGPFLAEARRASGGPLAAEMVLRDHDPLAPSTVQKLMELARRERASAILVTDKDWSKVGSIRADAWPCPVARPRLEMTFDRGGDALVARVLETVERGVPDDEDS